MKKIPAYLLFGNYFYGICTLGLAIESSLQYHLPLNSIAFYLLLFAATVLYYTLSYTGLRTPFSWSSDIPYPVRSNERSLWYYRHRHFIRRSLWLFFILALLTVVQLCRNIDPLWRQLKGYEVFLLFSPALLSGLYAGIKYKGKTWSLRHSGWLKPFVIGLVWAMVVTLYPLMFYEWDQGRHFILNPRFLWLLTKNWMFISILCILFDIKDYADDANRLLKTFVVRVGLRKTLFYIILPLSTIGLLAFWIYASMHAFSGLRILLNTLPFLVLIWVTYSLHKRKPIYYYLFAIDGLMLLKAACGSLAALYL